jgi:DHA2 family methylenomycin A resistance protein-like MFS transporter
MVVIRRIRSPHAALPVRRLTRRAAAATLGVGLAIYFTFYGVIFTLSFYFQQLLHNGPVRAGLTFAPMTR